MKRRARPSTKRAAKADTPKKNRFSLADSEALLDAACRRFPAGNPYGVFGFDVGSRIRRGLPLAEQTLRLYVERKSPESTRMLSRPFRLRAGALVVLPDIIATGSKPRTLEGETPSFSGLHVGAAILASRRFFGGVGALLSVGHGPSHLLTAGHLFAEGADDAPIQCAPPGREPKTIGRLVCNLLDRRRGAPPIDAALVQLNELGSELARMNDDPRVPRPRALFGGDPDGIRVQAFRPTAHGFSSENPVSDIPRVVHLLSSARPGGYTVRGVLRSSQEITRSGDSGTAFLVADEDRELVGTCVGVDGRGSIIEPIARTLGRLSETAQQSLDLWRKS